MPNNYTDAPELHPNLLLGSLQLLVWLIFHPSAWRNYVKRIDPDLSPNFCLLELERRHWRSPTLHRILILGYLIWPALLGSLLFFTLLPFEFEITLAGTMFQLGAALGVSIFLGTGFGVGPALISVVISCVAFGPTSAIAAYLSNSMRINPEYLTLILMIYSIFFIIFGSAISVTAHNLTTQRKLETRLQNEQLIPSILNGQITGSIVIGISLSVVIYLFAYSIVVNTGGREVFNFVLGGIPLQVSTTSHKLLYSAVFWLVSGLGLGLSSRIRTRKWRRSLITGLLLGLIAGSALYVATNEAGGRWNTAIFAGIAGGGWLAGLLALTYTLSEYIAGPKAGIVAGTFGLGGAHTIFLFAANNRFHWMIILFSSICVLIGLFLIYSLPMLLSPFFEVWDLLIYRRDEHRYDGRRPPLLRYNAAFWNELQRTASPTLQDHLNLIVKRTPSQGQAAIDYLATTPHHKVAQEAQIELDAHRLERCQSLEEIRQAHSYLIVTELNGPASNLLRRLADFSKAIDAAFEQTTLLHRRRALDDIQEQLAGWQRDLKRSDEAYAARFLPIAASWQQVVADYVIHLQREVELRQEVDNPYIHSLPLTEEQGIFFGRREIVNKIEQLVLDPRRPPLLLYGQRRMGKTSLLQNLGRLLHSKMSIVPMFVDGQEVKLAGSYSEFLDLVAYEMRRSAQETRQLTLPDSGDIAQSRNPFIRFIRWLDQVEAALTQQGYRIGLLMLDEFEEIKSIADKGRFDEKDILSLLRHMIQHRPRFKLLLAGSHTLQEFEQWASYLINVQVLKLGYLEVGEAHDLIETPIPNFPLRYEPEATRRITTLTRCHPHLVQLLCYEIVELKNSQPAEYRRLVTPDDVEEAAQKAIEGGDFFFANIKENQIDPAGLQLLTFLANHEMNGGISQSHLQQCLPDSNQLDQTLALLKRRDLIEADNGSYRFQVEMTRRWFAKQGALA